MTAATLTIYLDAIVSNWRALDALSAAEVETAAVVKANGYGLDAAKVATTLANAGVQSFFVAIAEEGVTVRKAVGNGPAIYVFSGMMSSDAPLIREYNLIPMLNSPAQLVKFRMQMPSLKFGLQLDTGMNRLGLEPAEFAMMRDKAENAALIISHLACADEPNHAQNAQQLDTFKALTDNMRVPRSLAATGGILLGADYHFNVTRPGVGLYGGEPFRDAQVVVKASLPIIQTRIVETGETVGYAAAWTAKRRSKIATVAAGYKDGLIRAMGNGDTMLWHNDTPCPIVGRVSMDLLTVDITDLTSQPEQLDILNTHQTVDKLAANAGTIGYEILTSLGARYKRDYIGG